MPELKEANQMHSLKTTVFFNIECQHDLRNNYRSQPFALGGRPLHETAVRLEY